MNSFPQGLLDAQGVREVFSDRAWTTSKDMVCFELEVKILEVSWRNSMEQVY